MKHPAEAKQLRVTARAPFHLYYDGAAKMVSATNKVGDFDILPGHADFFSVMAPGDVAIETDANVVSFPITSGIVTVHQDEVMLFVNI